MSRARSITMPGHSIHWFDTNRDHRKATAEQLELLAVAENISIDDLLDNPDLTQGQVIMRTRKVLGQGVIPSEVLERKRERKVQAQNQPKCRMCPTVGSSTRHHFVPRWIMRELDNYNAYSARSVCCIPLCVECHRDIHRRDGRPGKSIVPYLTEQEKQLAQRMLDDLKDQHSKMFDLIAAGNHYTYEGVLFRDYIEGKFHERVDSSASADVEVPVAAYGR